MKLYEIAAPMDAMKCFHAVILSPSVSNIMLKIKFQ
ncbi:hypothetical protein M8C21_005340 [Ambrosia artemisiifolia]|uniref:Uncharacterized protein n=1 Tax=Ambrosia artemisiifolia TaxID=4212 RepID=A0AAD5DEI7_AMBAR|nr:hypothetical protein M8C21_017057 [Ambrosia artemisiifolia]KAI7757266.1 hypothetical protein M8C21_005340 [Ambrosia artemisiifolia]